MVIENGFTYVAVLMLIVGGLLALQKYAKWKVLHVVPPLVWIYVINMILCTAGLYNSEGCSATYSALKNNILYAMIFVMLLLLTTGFVQNHPVFFARNQTEFLSARDFYLNFWRTFFYNSLRCTNAQATVAASTFFKCRDRRSRFQKISE